MGGSSCRSLLIAVGTVTVFVDDKGKREDSSLTVLIRAFDLTHTNKILIDVTAMAAVWDNKQTYIFYSQGQLAAATVSILSKSSFWPQQQR